MSSGYKWKKLVRTSSIKPPSQDLVKVWMYNFNISEEEARHRIDEEKPELWVNDLYQVQVDRSQQEQGMIHLNIRRRDGFPGRD